MAIPIHRSVLAVLEDAFRSNLRDVRVCTGPRSRAVLDLLRARAAAAGSYIFLRTPKDARDLALMAHEIAHVVTGQATRSHINFPSWINEGISVYSQREILADEKQAIDLAIRRNAVLPITSLGSSAQGSASTVSLFSNRM